MKLSILLIFVVVFCLQKEVVGGKDKYKYIWRVADGWQKYFVEGQKNYLLGVCQTHYNKNNDYSYMAEQISNQIYRDSNGSLYSVIIVKEGGISEYSSKDITFYYDNRMFHIFSKN